MEINYNLLWSFLLVFVVSSFCVAIGIGGGILYSPILGRLFKDPALGVYLSKLSILTTSLLGTSYHLLSDISTLIKFHKRTKISNPENLENELNEGPKTLSIPRLYFVLSMSLVPWCIIGSNVGTTVHFLTKGKFKFVFTPVVSLCILLTLLRLFIIYRNKKLKSELDNSNSPLNSHVSVESVAPEVHSEDKESQGFLHWILRSYDHSNAHTLKERVISTSLIAFCLVLYYISVRFEQLYVTIPLRAIIAALGLFYSIKLRHTFRRLNFYSNPSGLEPGEGSDKIPGTKFQKLLDTGIHFIILNIFVSFISGFFSGTIGIGSGIIMVPLLQFLSLNPVSCTATANLLTLVMSIATLSRFSTKVTFPISILLPVMGASLLGTSLSLFIIRSFAKDKITGLFVNFTLLILCSASIIVTWVI